MSKPLKIAALCAAGLLALSGCGSSPATHFYVLSAVPAERPAEAGADIALGVGPLELPEYLDRPQIVTRSGQNELNLGEFDRWGAPVKDNATEVLAENLAVLLPSNKISTYPWKRSAQIQYQVAAKITRFDRTEGGEAVLSARWRLLDGEGEELLARESRYAESPTGADYGDTVAAMNRLLAQWSREVALAVNSLRGSAGARK
ncbi:MAG: membrane integrity-associated transporter subunit PqiC [Candidatus Methylumidiphilus sp.]